MSQTKANTKIGAVINDSVLAVQDISKDDAILVDGIDSQSVVVALGTIARNEIN